MGESNTHISRCKKVKMSVLKMFLPLSLIFMIVFGGLVPVLPKAVNDNVPHAQDITVGVIFFISGLKLETKEIIHALKAWKALLFSVLSNLFISPWLGSLIVILKINIPSEFLISIAIFMNCPTTISSSVILTNEAYGNMSLALCTTVLCSFLAVFTIPALLPFTLSTISTKGIDGLDLDVLGILENLIETIFVPLIIGKVLMESFHAVRSFTQRHPVFLKLTSNLMLILTPWMQIGKNVEQLHKVTATSIVLLLVLAIAAHSLLLTFNFSCGTLLKLAKPELKAVIISPSEKSQVVALTVFNTLPPSLGIEGLMAIAVVCCHFTQIIIDSCLAAYWGNKYLKEQKLQAEKLEGLLEDDSYNYGCSLSSHEGEELTNSNSCSDVSGSACAREEDNLRLSISSSACSVNHEENINGGKRDDLIRKYSFNVISSPQQRTRKKI